MYQNRDEQTKDELPPFFGLLSADLKRPQNAFSTELQHLFRSSWLSLTTGLGYFDISGKLRTTSITILPPPFDILSTVTDTDVRHINAYNYANVTLLKNLTITVGASLDYLKGDPENISGGDETQFNPKFGITWTPLAQTTVRAAVFRELKRTLITDQTLEPTQVAGFNQFFDDPDFSDARRYGVGVDQKFSKDFFGGTEFSKRDLRIPILDVSGLSSRTRKVDGKEYLNRSYFFWTPHPWFALRAEYLFERFENEPLLGPKNLNTHRVPLGISGFHPSGLGSSLTATYYYQNGKLAAFPPAIPLAPNQSVSSNFWTVDAAINYRLQKRNGFVTIGVGNIFDKKFKYFNVNRDNPIIQPGRMALFRMTLALP